jgi:hypothetical protein
MRPEHPADGSHAARCGFKIATIPNPLEDVMTEAMTEATQPSPGVTRRDALLGLGAVAGAAAVVSAVPFKAGASSLASVLSQASAADLGPTIPGLTYVGIDAFAFFPNNPQDRVYQTLTGSQPSAPNNRIWAPLMIPAGSVVHQMNVGYQTQPIAEISRRRVAQPNPALAPAQVFQQTLPASPGGPFSSTLNLPTPVTIEQDSTYTVSFFCGVASSVFGCTVGYLPPTQGFVPFTGTPRVLDTRGGAKLAPGAELTVDLAMPGARSAVLNVTVTQTDFAGYIAVFPADIAWPGNSSVNWSAPNQNVANGVITKVDPTGRIKIRGGDAATHVIVDRIGYMI